MSAEPIRFSNPLMSASPYYVGNLGEPICFWCDEMGAEPHAADCAWTAWLAVEWGHVREQLDGALAEIERVFAMTVADIVALVGDLEPTAYERGPDGMRSDCPYQCHGESVCECQHRDGGECHPDGMGECPHCTT